MKKKTIWLNFAVIDNVNRVKNGGNETTPFPLQNDSNELIPSGGKTRNT